MSSNYYYLVASLPDIILDDAVEHSSYADFVDELMELLSDDDAELFRYLRYRYDNKNLLTIMGEAASKFNLWGNYSEEELRYEFDVQDSIPEYMRRIIDAFRSSSPIYYNMSWEDQLNWLYYEGATEIDNCFLGEWLEFELDLRNLLTALNCRRFNIPLERRVESRLEQPITQNIICRNETSEAILKGNPPDFSLTPIQPWVEDLLSFDSSNLVEYEKNLDQLRWVMLDDMTSFSGFQIETLLAFVIKLEMVHRWRNLQPERGMEIFSRLVGDLEGGFELNDDYVAAGSRV